MEDPSRVERAEELAAEAHRRHTETTQRLHEVVQAREAAAANRLPVVPWRDDLRADLQARWQDVQRRAADLHRTVPPVSAPRRPGLALFGADFLWVAEPAAIASAVLEAALALSGAQKGNVQLADHSGALRIAAQHGFGPDFLTFFEVVADDRSACGAAMARGRAVRVRDVESSALFREAPAREVLLDERVRAVHSVPLPDPAGGVLGVLSVHYRRPHDAGPAEQSLLATLARAGARRLATARR